MIDLHVHSRVSDGTLTPSELAHMASDRGLSAWALTDHDTFAGLKEARDVSASLGIRFIEGIEIEIAFSPGEFHLLGYNVGSPTGELRKAVERLEKARVARNKTIVSLIRDAGIPFEWDELLAEAGGQAAGRPHFANLLVAKKAAKNRQDAFDKYLAKGRPFYSPKDCLELSEAVRMLHESNAKAFVAHPLSLFISWSRLSSLMDSWKELGVDGIEAYHPLAKLQHCRRLEKMAKERGLAVTAGSDFHGANRPGRKLGITSGDLPIDDSFLEAL